VQDGPDHVIRPGENVSISFDKAGEYPYICTFHAQDMKGTVIVATS
jgi:plastocyanin